MTDLLDTAIAIAVEAHRRQKEKNGQPFVLHPLRVMLRCEAEDERIVGVLHDVVEDCPGWTFARLRRRGFPQHLLDALDCVTRRKGESYEAFIERCASDALARRVKVADLEDNMDIRRLPKITEGDCVRLKRYLRAYRWLCAQSSYTIPKNPRETHDHPENRRHHLRGQPVLPEPRTR